MYMYLTYRITYLVNSLCLKCLSTGPIGRVFIVYHWRSYHIHVHVLLDLASYDEWTVPNIIKFTVLLLIICENVLHSVRTMLSHTNVKGIHTLL